MKNQECFYLMIEIEGIQYVFRILEAQWNYELEYLNISNKSKAVEKGVLALVQLVHYAGDAEGTDLVFSFNKVVFMFLDSTVKTYTAEEIEDIYPVYLDEIADSAFSSI